MTAADLYAQAVVIAGALLDRGDTEKDARILLGDNWLHLFAEVSQ